MRRPKKNIRRDGLWIVRVTKYGYGCRENNVFETINN